MASCPPSAPLFAYVHVWCWPILWWQINRFCRWTGREGITDALYTLNRRGVLTVVFLGDRARPEACKPFVRTFRALMDESWVTSLRAVISARAARDTRQRLQIAACPVGEAATLRRELAGRALTPNTS